MENAFANNNMEHKNIERLICALAAALLLPVFATAQSRLKGTVVDENSEPLIGAAILVQGGQNGNGTVTDLDGNFEISVPNPSTLLVSSIGFEDKTLRFEGQSEVRIVMKLSTTVLEEVVVVGYGAMTKKEMTSAISHVSSKDLNQVTSLDSRMLLQGKVSGLNVDNSQMADPNQQASIQIRGVASRQAGTGPLYVIDGVPGGDMTNINPADIESIDVLKDGAASAIYGTRGGNGVVLVNLKKGSRDGNVHTQYSGSFTVNHPKRELYLLTPNQYRMYRCVDNPLNDFGANTDWFKAATRTGIAHMHTLTVSGGNAKSNYRVTADYRYATGVDLRSDRREYGARANVSHTTKSGLFTFTAGLSPRIIRKNESVGFGAILQNNPTFPVYDKSSANGYYHFGVGVAGSNLVETAREVEDGGKIHILEANATARLNLLPLFTPDLPGSTCSPCSPPISPTWSSTPC